MPNELQVLEVNGSSEGGVKKCASSPCSVMLFSSAAQGAELAGCEKPFLNVTGGRVAAILSTQALHVLRGELCLSNDGGLNCLALGENAFGNGGHSRDFHNKRQSRDLYREVNAFTRLHITHLVSGQMMITLTFLALRFVKLMNPYMDQGEGLFVTEDSQTFI